MEISCIWEHNGNDTLLYCDQFPGAYARGTNLNEGLGKIPEEIRSYCRWASLPCPEELTPVVAFEQVSDLAIQDADSDVIFPSERLPLTQGEYEWLKGLVLRSARDFHALFLSLPDPDRSALSHRETFYGQVPVTGGEMYAHTKSVNSYYFAEIGVEADSRGTILACRERGFAALEKNPDFLTAPAEEGSYGEIWSLKKVLRRFLWHDRIHARAMYRMAVKTFGEGAVPDIFRFYS